VNPIASGLELDVYDIEQRGGTWRITLDTPPGSPSGVDMEKLSLATRLISRDLDHEDPVPGHYTLEVTSPGVERTLRIPAHFQREIGKRINVRLSSVDAEQRRLEGVLIAADDKTATLRIDDSDPDAPVDRTIRIASVDRARTVFEWGPQPKPAGKGVSKAAAKRPSGKQPAANESPAEAPVAKKAVAKKLAAKKLAAKKPTAKKPASKQPARKTETAKQSAATSESSEQVPVTNLSPGTQSPNIKESS
jgi:ribosome maturation factor RimP